MASGLRRSSRRRSIATSPCRAASSGRLLERDAAILEQMQAEFDLHPLAVEDARHGHQHPKIEEYGDSLFAVMHLLEPGEGGLRVGEVDVFAGPNYLLTIRSGAEQGSGRARTLRARAGTAALRLRLRALRAHRCRGGPLLPAARRHRDRTRGDRDRILPVLRRARTSRRSMDSSSGWSSCAMPLRRCWMR